MKRVIAALRARGATLLRNNGHPVWRLPNGGIFTHSSTPSDVHAEDNALRQLRTQLDGVPVHSDGERR